MQQFKGVTLTYRRQGLFFQNLRLDEWTSILYPHHILQFFHLLVNSQEITAPSEQSQNSAPWKGFCSVYSSSNIRWKGKRAKPSHTFTGLPPVSISVSGRLLRSPHEMRQLPCVNTMTLKLLWLHKSGKERSHSRSWPNCSLLNLLTSYAGEMTRCKYRRSCTLRGKIMASSLHCQGKTSEQNYHNLKLDA